jgi:hypothetical protein
MEPKMDQSKDPTLFSSQMDGLINFTSKAENFLEKLSTPIKPFLPTIARFLLVVTFLEDSVRITSQWSDQVSYLRRHQGIEK